MFLLYTTKVHLASGKPLPPFSLCVGDVESEEPKFVGSCCYGVQSNCNMQLISRDGKVTTLSFLFNNQPF